MKVVRTIIAWNVPATWYIDPILDTDGDYVDIDLTRYRIADVEFVDGVKFVWVNLRKINL